MTVSTGSFVANPGAVVTAPVAIDDMKGLSYASVRLAYDSQVLVPLKTAEGSLRTVFDADFVTVGDLREGWISVSAFGRTNAAASVSGTVADVTFAVRAGTAGLYSDVTVTKVELGDTSGLRDVTADRTVTAASGMVRVMGAARVTYAMPTVRITSFDPATGRLGIKVEPGAGNAIVDELATGYVHVYGTERLGEAMHCISQVGFDLTPYLKAETKGEATLTVTLGAHAFFKVKFELQHVQERE